MKKTEFEAFFKPYSKNVDNANRHGFWKLSDAIITQIILDSIQDKDNNRLTILDAGGGTGRWVCDLSRIYKARFLVFDLSGDMLNKARENIAAAKIGDRVSIVQGDLQNMHKVASESIDHIISIYSPVSFIEDKAKALSELFRILKKGGKALIMGHAFYNAVGSKINNYLAGRDELLQIDTDKMVKWGEHVPKLNVFSKEIIEKDMRQAGFSTVQSYGVPVFAQPGPEDFDSENSKKSRISAALEDKGFFKQVFDLEMKYNAVPTVVNRGMNLFAVGTKK
jgi:ubiquinone/menaquinone biosynthesis C-methylase UbiE